jgi:hypothetical protein
MFSLGCLGIGSLPIIFQTTSKTCERSPQVVTLQLPYLQIDNFRVATHYQLFTGCLVASLRPKVADQPQRYPCGFRTILNLGFTPATTSDSNNSTATAATPTMYPTSTTMTIAD